MNFSASAFTRKRRIGRYAATSVTAAILLAIASVSPAFATTAELTECTGDECDGGLWKVARGEFNELSYWQMGAGHNCTNYVAWRLESIGVPKPNTHPGNAATWAERANAEGFVVNHLPAAGSVAHWDAFAAGHDEYGHVAYVEKVYSDGTIMISEDSWQEDGLGGPLTYRIIDATTVSNFIHYTDNSRWLREVTSLAGGWQERNAGLLMSPTSMSLTAPVGSAPRMFYLQDGQVFDATQADGGWVTSGTGMMFAAEALSVADMGRSSPYVMLLNAGKLYMNVKTAAGWQKMSTGVEITGEIAAFNLGGLWPTVMVSQEGTLYRVYGDNDGWHVESTGLEVDGAISAVNVGGIRPEVYSIESGVIQRSWWDEFGWHKESIEIPANGVISAIEIDGNSELVLAEDRQLFRVARDENGVWSKAATGAPAGTAITAVPFAGEPLVVQAG